MKLVGYDSETFPFRPGLVAPKMVCASWRDGEDKGILLREEGLDLLEGWLRDPQVQVVGHNLSFDLVVAAAERPGLLEPIVNAALGGRLRCTFVRQALLDVAAGEADFRRGPNGIKPAGKGLDDLVLHYYGVELPKKGDGPEDPGWWRTRYYLLDGVLVDEWPEPAQRYSLDDAIYAVGLFRHQAIHASYLRALPDMEGVWESDDGEIPDELQQMKHTLWLQLMSSEGLRTDPRSVAALRVLHEREKAELIARMIPTGIYRPDGSRDMKFLQARVVVAYAAKGEQPPGTKGGAVSTSGEVLTESGDPILVEVGESLSEMTTRNAWLPHLEEGTRQPLCVSYNPILETGRVSARKPNIMNPPRKGDVRACFRARAGRLFSFCDYETAELRALGQVCIWLVGYSDLAEALARGEDPHLSLAADMAGLSYEEALALYESGDQKMIDDRQDMKIPNFALPGGMGLDGFMRFAKSTYGKVMERHEAQRSRDGWFRRWREMHRFFEVVHAAVGDDGGPMQQFVSKRVRGGCRFTQAANGTFQGLIADGAKQAGWRLMEECYLGRWTGAETGRAGLSPLHGSRPVLFMHDEFGLEVPEDRASPAAARQQEVMRQALQGYLPDVPVKCGAVLTRRWHKGAKALRNAAGDLMPSKPIKVDGKVKWIVDDGLEAAA